AVNHEAYEAYLKGRYFWNQRTPESIALAITLFQQAISIDPKFALAYVGLADCYISMGAHAGARPKDIYPNSKQAAIRALDIDNGLGEAHASLAYEKDAYEWD